MALVRDCVILTEKEYSMSACFEGVLKAIPSSPAGREKRFHSGLLGGGLPVKAGGNK